VAFLKDWIEQPQLTDPEAIVFPCLGQFSVFRKASKRAKTKDLRLHDLRHDAATRFWKTHKDLALR
jgi:hypothetical protein